MSIFILNEKQLSDEVFYFISNATYIVLKVNSRVAIFLYTYMCLLKYSNFILSGDSYIMSLVSNLVFKP